MAFTNYHQHLLDKNDLFGLFQDIDARAYEELDSKLEFLKKYWLLFNTSETNFSWEKPLSIPVDYAPHKYPAMQPEEFIFRQHEPQVTGYKFQVDIPAWVENKDATWSPRKNRVYEYFNLGNRDVYITAEEIIKFRKETLKDDLYRKQLWYHDTKDLDAMDCPLYYQEKYLPSNPGQIIVTYDYGPDSYLEYPTTPVEYPEKKQKRPYNGPTPWVISGTYDYCYQLFVVLTEATFKHPPECNNNQELVDWLKKYSSTAFCKNCGAVYSIFANPSEYCPTCTAELGLEENVLVGNEAHMDYIQYEQDYEEDDEEDNNWNDIND